MTSPTPTSAIAQPNRKLSIRRVRTSHTRPSELEAAQGCSIALILAVARAAATSAGPGSGLAEQVVLEHLARDRRGGLRAEAAVLDQHGERDLRLVGGRVGDEPGVVAQALVDLAARRISRP